MKKIILFERIHLEERTATEFAAVINAQITDNNKKIDTLAKFVKDDGKGWVTIDEAAFKTVITPIIANFCKGLKAVYLSCNGDLKSFLYSIKSNKVDNLNKQLNTDLSKNWRNYVFEFDDNKLSFSLGHDYNYESQAFRQYVATISANLTKALMNVIISQKLAKYDDLSENLKERNIKLTAEKINSLLFGIFDQVMTDTFNSVKTIKNAPNQQAFSNNFANMQIINGNANDYYGDAQSFQNNKNFVV